MSWPMRQPPAGCLALRIPMRGYEQHFQSSYSAARGALRIPMRGYEKVVKTLPQEAEKVTNPHEGL